MEQAARKRRPRERGYARGEEARLRIVAAAIPLFSHKGYDGVSTREIAARAGVRPAALQYYFGGKEGLYGVCGEHVANRIGHVVEPQMLRAERLLAGGAAAATLIEAYCDIVESLADLLFGEAEAAGWAAFFATGQAGVGPCIAFSLLRLRFFDRMHAVGAAMIGRLTGRSAEDLETRLRFFAIEGQLMMFHTARRAVLTHLGRESFGPGHARLIKSLIVDQTRILLSQMAAARTKTAP
ncbi:MAG TPA: CerR family C-terminal domain-containing protein [Caulobacteraceae bacterium]|jgi:AcrR family transcriptional regulator|nr:CerR family C-terminal domain-containing protein [Caulobacteraceae bacterium]